MAGAHDQRGAHDDRGALRLQEVAARQGAYRWVELRLFELTGSWAAAPGLPDGARRLLFEASTSHAWHAELWWDRLPVLSGVDRERLTRPIGSAVEPLLASLVPGAFPADGEIEGRRFCVGLARVVLPLLLVSYRRFGERLVPVADQPTIRALGLVVSDTEEELEASEVATDALCDGPEVAQQAAEWTRSLGDPVWTGGDGEELFPWSQADLAW